MATFNATGIEGLDLSLEEFAAIPDNVVEEMLDAAGQVVVRHHKAQIRAQGLVHSGKPIKRPEAPEMIISGMCWCIPPAATTSIRAVG